MPRWEGTRDATAFALGTNAQIAIYIDSGQRVVVGGAEPRKGENIALHVRTPGGYDAPQVQVTQDKVNDHARVRFQAATEDATGRPALWDVAVGKDQFHVWRGDGGPSGGKNLLNITSDGSVGIGDNRQAPQARLDIDGAVRASRVSVESGAISQTFDCDMDVEPGSIVGITERGGSQLGPTRLQYDPGVIGIVAGAKNTTPGVSLGPIDRVVVRRVSVVIGGCAWCRAEADSSPIRPGDRLVSSELNGVAMAAVDTLRGSGAVVGKAMTSLELGQGLVLVFVALA